MKEETWKEVVRCPWLSYPLPDPHWGLLLGSPSPTCPCPACVPHGLLTHLSWPSAPSLWPVYSLGHGPVHQAVLPLVFPVGITPTFASCRAGGRISARLFPDVLMFASCWYLISWCSSLVAASAWALLHAFQSCSRLWALCNWSAMSWFTWVHLSGQNKKQNPHPSLPVQQKQMHTLSVKLTADELRRHC